MMTPLDKKPVVNRVSPGALRLPLGATVASSPVPSSNTTSTTTKPIIATPPRAATARGQQSISKTADADSSSLKSSKSVATIEDKEVDDEDDEDSSVEKDAKIKALQKEISLAEVEFEKELLQLSHKLTNSQEELQFWQNKHSVLNQTYLKSDTDVRLLRASLQSQEDAQQEVHKRLGGLVMEREKWREAYEQVMGECKRKEGEIAGLREQVSGLKNWVSRDGARGGEQVADEAFGDKMGKLADGLQNWVIVHFRRVKLDLEKADEKTKEELLRLIPTYESLAATSKIQLVQSLVSRLLVESIFQPYFVGLTKNQTEEFEKVEKTLSGFGPAESINTWRATTLSIIRKEASKKLETVTSATIDSVIKQINTIMTAISDLQPAEQRDQSLRALTKESIELSQLLRVQKAVFTVVMPSLEDHQRTMFDSESMEDMGGEDEDSLSDREIRCVTFPGVFKAGDEHGEREYLKNVVSKIRVLCAPD